MTKDVTFEAYFDRAEIKRCPFCGGQAERVEWKNRLAVRCSDCHAQTGYMAASSSDKVMRQFACRDVIADWNKRESEYA